MASMEIERIDTLEFELEDLQIKFDNVQRQFDEMDQKFNLLNSKLDALLETFDNQFKVVEETIDNINWELTKLTRWK